MTGMLPPSGEFLFEAARQRALAGIMAEGWIGRRLGPYRLVASIGSGGMGAVYFAERDDGQFRKQVAVKLIRPELVDPVAMERFRNERQLLADLEHPNIARLLDGGETADGTSYIIMEYVEGKPVTSYCSDRQASTTERLALFQQLCGAVAYSHARGIVHCDLKPANILVTATGDVKLVDFGIARPVNPAERASRRHHGSTGMLTPDYASPEQVRGDPMTAATDVYSLGAVLYELLSGTRPHRIESHCPEAVKRAVCEVLPEAPGLDADLDRILLRALAKHPADRYPSAESLSEDIGRYLAGQPVRAIPSEGKRGRAILCGVALMFASGCVAFLASWHSRVQPSPAQPFRAQPSPAQSSPAQSSPAQSAASKLSARAKPAASKPEPGRLRGATRKELLQCIDSLERVIEAATRGGGDDLVSDTTLVDQVVTLGDVGAGEPGVVIRRKPKAMRQTPSLDARLANAHTSLGFAQLAANWDWSGAERQFREAIRLRPEFARAWAGYHYLLMKANRRREAMEAARRLHRLAPMLSRLHGVQAQLRYRNRDFTGVTAEIEASLDRRPGGSASHYLLALSYGHLNQLGQALEELGKASLLPEMDLSNRGWLYGTAGRTGDANTALAGCRQTGGDCLMALIGLGHHEEALSALQAAFQKHSPVLLDLRSDPRFDTLRADPRFADLERRVGFPSN